MTFYIDFNGYVTVDAKSRDEAEETFWNYIEACKQVKVENLKKHAYLEIEYVGEN